MIGVTILGSTGSIGVSTLDVLSRHPDEFSVCALTANQDYKKLFEQCQQFKPAYAVIVDEQAAKKFADLLADSSLKTELLIGAKHLLTVAELIEAQYVMAAIVGAAGLLPTLAAAKSGKRILLANKEALVMSGKLFLDEVRQNNAELLPIDSEHNAIFQCMPTDCAANFSDSGVNKILLTASGGPFRNTPLDQLESVTPDQACAHPNWDMGRKISVDSATMMNKGLEVIEACWLFNTSSDYIQVVVHPQSIIHSMVQYNDGSVLAQMGQPDMRTPIAHALGWPNRMQSGVEALDLFAIENLQFEQPDLERFPCLALAYDAMNSGGAAPAILNAANEIAVSAFLSGELGFTKIASVIEQTLNTIESGSVDTLELVLAADQAARKTAQEVVHGGKF
jgi:1-deoxy-D-xylulose-5-phosphate reductoisomerase